MFQSHRFTQFADRISQIMAVVYQGIALVALLVIPFQARQCLSPSAHQQERFIPIS